MCGAESWEAPDGVRLWESATRFRTLYPARPLAIMRRNPHCNDDRYAGELPSTAWIDQALHGHHRCRMSVAQTIRSQALIERSSAVGKSLALSKILGNAHESCLRLSRRRFPITLATIRQEEQRSGTVCRQVHGF